jgi:hypothetical protein
MPHVRKALISFNSSKEKGVLSGTPFSHFELRLNKRSDQVVNTRSKTQQYQHQYDHASHDNELKFAISILIRG